MEKDNNTVSIAKTWLASNLWNILSLIVVLFAAAIYLKTDVKANSVEIEKLQEIVSKYPSEKWFDLKFETIDKRFDMLEKSIK